MSDFWRKEMKYGILIVACAITCTPRLYGQATNDTGRPEVQPEKPAVSENGPELPKRTRDKQSAFKKRQLRLMERALKEIGVTEEQRQQISVLQEEHMRKMKANWKRMNEARRELSRLQDSGASMDELNAAIQEVSNAQTEQLQILVHNRREMEKILGKEKNDLLMKKAHEYFSKHGRRPGAGMPPRPGAPPLPGKKDHENSIPPPPLANNTAASNAPPIP